MGFHFRDFARLYNNDLFPAVTCEARHKHREPRRIGPVVMRRRRQVPLEALEPRHDGLQIAERGRKVVEQGGLKAFSDSLADQAFLGDRQLLELAFERLDLGVDPSASATANFSFDP